MSFSLQSLAPETRTSVPASVLLDHFKASTASSSSSSINQGTDARSSRTASSASDAFGRKEGRLSDSNGIIHTDIEHWRTFDLTSSADCLEVYDDDSDSRGGYSNLGYMSAYPGSPVPTSSSATLPSSSSSSSSSSSAYMLSSKGLWKDPSRPSPNPQSAFSGGCAGAGAFTGMTSISTMTRCLSLWVRAWSQGSDSPEHDFPSTQQKSLVDKGTGGFGMGEASTLNVSANSGVSLTPPRAEHCSALSTYGARLLSVNKPDFAVAYMRTLHRLVQSMRMLPCTHIALHSGHVSTKRSLESQLEDSQGSSTAGLIDKNSDREGALVKSNASIRKAISAWEEAVYNVELAIQSSAVELYGAELSL